MTVANRSHILATRIFMNWVDKQFVRFHTKSSTILIRPGSCSETVCGTSYYNEGYANFVIQLTIQFYRQPNPIHV